MPDAHFFFAELIEEELREKAEDVRYAGRLLAVLGACEG
jgi:hypothetical protein